MKPTPSLLVALAAVSSTSVLAQFQPPVAVDINPAANVVEVNISATPATWQYIPGNDTQVWAYSDDSPGGSGPSVPGPTIKARLGDTVIVHFTNNLPEPTTLHWHGVKIPADMDGSHISQRPVHPGEKFDYEFVVLSEGLYWYHPHVRPFDQVEKGLYAALLVKDPSRDQAVFNSTSHGNLVVQERIVIFDDILLDSNYQVVPAFSFTDPLQNALYHVNGRVGNHLLVNGKEASGVTLNVLNGALQRWHVLNAANTTICRLDLADPSTGIPNLVLWELGNDGGYNDRPFKRFKITSTAPTVDHPQQALIAQGGEGILLFPGERTHLGFMINSTVGRTFTIQQNDWFRGRHIAMQPGGPGTQIMLPDDPLDGSYPNLPYFKMQVTGQQQGGVTWFPNFRFNPPVVPAPQGVLPVTFGHGFPDPAGNVMFFAQAKMASGQMVPLPGAQIDSFEARDVNVGEVWDWEVTNLTHGDHPFHAHGFFFELLELEFQDDTQPGNNQVNFKFTPFARRMVKDTIRVPARLGAKGTSRTIVRLRTHFDDTGREGRVVAQGQNATYEPNGNWTSGGWLFHCHVLEHSAKGMISFLEVRDPSAPFVLLGKHLAGTKGNPHLTANGSPSTLSNLDLTNAPGHWPVFLVASNVLGNMPIFGGTLVPRVADDTDHLIVPGATDSEGEFTWWFPSGADIPSYSQVVFPDIGGPMGWAFSNAIERL